MEAEKQTHSPVLTILELLCLCIGMSAICFTLYAFPYVVWDATYSVPDFVIWLQYWYKLHQDLTAFLIIFLPPTAIGILFFFLAHKLSQTPGTEEQKISPDEITNVERFFNRPRSILKLIGIFLLLVVILIILAKVLDIVLGAALH